MAATLAAITLIKGIFWIALFPVFKIADEPTHYENIAFRGEELRPPRQLSDERFGNTIHDGSPADVKLAWERGLSLFRNHHVSGVRSVHEETLLRDMASDRAARHGSGHLTSANYPGFYYNTAVPVYLVFKRLSILTRVPALRFVSLMFGIMAVVATFFTARLIMKSQALAVAAAVVVLLQPMESQMSAAINNDAGVIGLGAVLLYLQIRFIMRAPEIPALRLGVLMALLAGAIVFTKPQGWAMLPGCGFACAWVVARNLRQRRAWIFAAVTAAIAGVLLLASLHQMQATGQTAVIASTPGSTTAAASAAQPGFWTFLRSLDASYKYYLFRSFFGQFGWLEYALPAYWIDCIRHVWTVVQVGAVAALVVRIARIPGWTWLSITGFLFCIGTALFALAFILFAEHRFRLIHIWGVIQGRNLLFALPALAIAAAASYGALVPARFRTLSAAALATSAVGLHVGSIICIFRNYYGT